MTCLSNMYVIRYVHAVIVHICCAKGHGKLTAAVVKTCWWNSHMLQHCCNSLVLPVAIDTLRHNHQVVDDLQMTFKQRAQWGHEFWRHVIYAGITLAGNLNEATTSGSINSPRLLQSWYHHCCSSVPLVAHEITLFSIKLVLIPVITWRIVKLMMRINTSLI